MQDYIFHTATVFMGFLAIMNPIANTPIFLSLTANEDEAARRKIARNSLILVFVLILTFCIAGRVVFVLFGISMSAFRVTGGLLVYLIGFHMLQGQPSSVHKPSDDDQQDSRTARLSVAVSPLAMPILAGPGTIATAMNFASTGDLFHVTTTLIAFFVLCLITYLFFVFGERLVHFVGTSAINAITRLMGLVLAVIGTQMVIDGVGDVVATFK